MDMHIHNQTNRIYVTTVLRSKADEPPTIPGGSDDTVT